MEKPVLSDSSIVWGNWDVSPGESRQTLPKEIEEQGARDSFLYETLNG